MLFRSEMKDAFKNYSLADLFQEIINEDCEYFSCEGLYDELSKCVTEETFPLMMQCNHRLTNVLILLRQWSEAHPSHCASPDYFCDETIF